MNDPHEIANTFHDYFLTVTEIVKGNIKKVTMIPGKTWILPNTWLTTLTAHFQVIIGTRPQLMKLIRLSNP